MRQIRATEFKAKCLAILDEVEQTGEHVLILKRGRAVAEILPPLGSSGEFPQVSLRGSVTILGDVIEPAVPAEQWNAVQGRVV